MYVRVYVMYVCMHVYYVCTYECSYVCILILCTYKMYKKFEFEKGSRDRNKK